MVRSWKVALPAPPPPPPGATAPEFVTPHENESTSISSLCLASIDSPLMSPIFAKMCGAIWTLLNNSLRHREPGSAAIVGRPVSGCQSNRRGGATEGGGVWAAAPIRFHVGAVLPVRYGRG